MLKIKKIGGLLIVLGLIIALIYFFLISFGFISRSILSNEIKIAGSTTVFPLAVSLSKEFKKKHPEVKFTITQSSTGEGFKKFINGEIDISNATRYPKDNEYIDAGEKGHEFYVTPIARDAVFIIVNKSKAKFINEIDRVTLRKIFFDGSITDWNQLNKELSGPIHVYIRKTELSGTASLFNETVAGASNAFYVDNAILVHRTPEVVDRIAEDENGIGYSPAKWINDNVKVLKYGEFLLIEPKLENILSGKYALIRELLMITDGVPRGMVAKFIKFVISKEGRNLIKKEGFINL